ncbi:MAG TPA: DUF5522 domain-containing protein [Cyclobacteriaceae bacterium]
MVKALTVLFFVNQSKLKEKEKDNVTPPEPDYYEENGLIVFTRSYHLRRGYCCQSGCRHCPYGFKKNKDNESGLQK